LLGLFPFVVLYFIISHKLELSGRKDLLPASDFFMLCFGVQLLMIAGFILNDIVDRDIDKINKPETHTVDRLVSLRAAWLLFSITTALVIIVSLYISRYILPEWTFISPVVYLFSVGYDLYFKRMPLIGNIVMAALAGFVPLVIMFFAKEPLVILNDEKLYVLIWLYALLPFSIIIPRELSLDISDMEGDKACGCKTLPILIGPRYSKLIVAVMVLLIVLVSVPVMIKYTYLAITLSLMDAMLLFYIYQLYRVQTRLEYIRIGRFLWLAMIVGILGATLVCV
jgi:4-hydroxybenzoate polyprenyltransferase